MSGWLTGLTLLMVVLITGIASYAGYRTADNQWQLKWSQRDTADTQAKARQEATNRTIEQERQRSIERISEDAEQKIQAAQADAATADVAADRLHGAISTLQQRLRDSESTINSGLTGRCQAEARAASLLAELLQQSDKRAGEYAAAADDARIRGLACEAAYDAMRQNDISAR